MHSNAIGDGPIARTPRLVVLTTGGTIAATGRDAAATTIYALDDGGNPLRDALPALDGVAAIEREAVAHLPSHDLDDATLLRMAARIAHHRARAEVDGIVVTHGTDTLEETAFFLDLVLARGKPVVLTGAARPATALSADGPLNLLNAARVALSPTAAGEGVLVCLNDRVATARAVTKAHTSAPDALRAPEQGYLGAVTGGEVAFHARARMGPAPFALPLAAPLPRVDIVYAHHGMDGALVEAVIAAGARGIVVAATGNGSLAAAVKPALARAREAGLVVVRSTRVGSGAVTAALADDELGTLPAGSLNPQKARLLLQLALEAGHGRDEVAALFRAF